MSHGESYNKAFHENHPGAATLVNGAPRSTGSQVTEKHETPKPRPRPRRWSENKRVTELGKKIAMCVNKEGKENQRKEDLRFDSKRCGSK